MTDQTSNPSTSADSEPVSQASKPAPLAPPAGQSGGLNISAGGGVSAGGDIVGGDKTTTNSPGGPGSGTSPKAVPGSSGLGKGEASVKSSWANGLFYLFAFVVIVGVLGFFANSLDLTTLVLLVVAGVVAVPVLGALQLRMDRRLSEKSFLSLMKMSIAQLPVIGGLVKK